MDRSLLHRPIAGFLVVTGKREAMPILVVQLGVICAVVISRPARFFAKQRVLGHAFRGQDTMLKLPAALQLMQIFGAKMLSVFLQHSQKLNPACEQRLIGRVMRTNTGAIFVHDLL